MARSTLALVPLLVASSFVVGCSSRGGASAAPQDGGAGVTDAGLADAAVDPSALATTLTDLAAFGQKRVGTPAGAQAGDYVIQRMKAAGLDSVTTDSFDLPRYDLDTSSATLSIAGAAPTPLGYDVFEASGTGKVDADVVYVTTARPSEIQAAGDVTGKIVLVDRDLTYHRSTQAANVAKAGAVAMIMGSVAPNNLRQIGSVRWAWETKVAIPTITIGQTDADAIKAALAAKPPEPVHATLDVESHTTPAVGRNVVGVLKGTDATQGEIVVGAHYDTWFTGSTDNGGGVAGLLALAERRAKKARPAPSVVFVGYDGEEVALFGGYQFLRLHRIVGQETMLAVLNFETPSSKQGGGGFAHSDIPGFDAALRSAGLDGDYSLYATMGTVPQLFGGIIPTDVQGIYRSGIPTASTAVNGPYYHTSEDTPDKVDTAFLATLVEGFDAAIDALAQTGPTCCSAPDSEIWRAQASLAARAETDPIVVTATVVDSTGAPQANAAANATLLYDDFFPAGDVLAGTTDASGKVTFTFPASVATQGAGQGTGARWVHVTAGVTYPLCEEIVKVP